MFTVVLFVAVASFLSLPTTASDKDEAADVRMDWFSHLRPNAPLPKGNFLDIGDTVGVISYDMDDRNAFGFGIVTDILRDKQHWFFDEVQMEDSGDVITKPVGMCKLIKKKPKDQSPTRDRSAVHSELQRQSVAITPFAVGLRVCDSRDKSKCGSVAECEYLPLKREWWVLIRLDEPFAPPRSVRGRNAYATTMLHIPAELVKLSDEYEASGRSDLYELAKLRSSRIK